MLARLFALALVLVGVCMVAMTFIPTGTDEDAVDKQRDAVRDYYVAQKNERESDTKAVIRVPSWGPNYVMPIVDSVKQDVLDSGVVGHFPGTGPVGEGNYALAGHVVTNGEPFARLNELEDGDLIVIESGGKVYKFSVTDKFTVDYTDTSVLDYRPSTLTLVTCASRYVRTDERTVVIAALV